MKTVHCLIISILLLSVVLLAGCGSSSAPANSNVVTGLAATAVTPSTVSLVWNAVPATAGSSFSYKLYRNGAYLVTVSGAANATTVSYTDASLTAATTYLYSVTSLASNGAESAQSTAIVTTTLTADGKAPQKNVLNLSAITATLAGSAGFYGTKDGTGADALFNGPLDFATDGTNLYVTDYLNSTIRKIVKSSGAVTTFAGTAGSAAYLDGAGTAARFNGPLGLAADSTYLYVSEQVNHTIRRIELATGIVTTIAGSAGAAGSTDAVGTAAQFNMPTGLAISGSNLYVADRGNNTIRKIDLTTTTVTTVAGASGSAGSADGVAGAARFAAPSRLATDGTVLYVTDNSNRTVRLIHLASSTVLTVAGNVGVSGSKDAQGSSAQFNTPNGIVTDGVNLYLTDSANNTLRKIALASGTVSTIAGSTGVAGSADGAGTAARFNYPMGLISDGVSLYLGDNHNNTIRVIR